ncbi:MAG: RNA-binding protein [Defluviitaleaceae bacterium]|nr:RNA-binding protein [Defluviitaleaceae bacterium]
MDLKIGQIVISKAGRDKGKVFVVLGLSCEKDGEFAFLVDGGERSVAKPKKKKYKHIQPTLTLDVNLAEMIAQKANLKDSDFKAAIKNFEAKKI